MLLLQYMFCTIIIALLSGSWNWLGPTGEGARDRGDVSKLKTILITQHTHQGSGPGSGAKLPQAGQPWRPRITQSATSQRVLSPRCWGSPYGRSAAGGREKGTALHHYNIFMVAILQASAIGQSGFDKGRHKGLISGFLEALKPPYRGVTVSFLLLCMHDASGRRKVPLTGHFY
jgi:hypothetical protein